jgi:hypothetical protein
MSDASVFGFKAEYRSPSIEGVGRPKFVAALLLSKAGALTAYNAALKALEHVAIRRVKSGPQANLTLMDSPE